MAYSTQRPNAGQLNDTTASPNVKCIVLKMKR